MAEQRDYVMARLAASRGMIAAASEALDTCIVLFVFPDDDKGGKERNEALEALLDASGDLSRSIELAQAAFETISKEELAEGEPDSEEEDPDGREAEDED